MKFKPAAAWLPLVLLLLSGAARADLEPFSFGAGESLKHESNIYHDDTDHKSDWLSTTDLHAALDQAIGRDRLTANAAVNYTKYRTSSQRDALGYDGGVNLDWNTIGDLSGSLGVNSARSVYIYGINDESAGGSGGRNLQTTNHGFARLQLGGLARWKIFGGIDAMNRNYSLESYKSDEQRQWTSNVGTNYSTSPDLSFGVVGNYVRGEYPYYPRTDGEGTFKAGFSSRAVSATTQWQASGNSALNAQVGYTEESSDLQPKRNFVNANLNWTWTPPSHFKVQAGLARGSSGGIGSAAVNTLNDRSLNTSGNLDVSYVVTSKISLAGDVSYIERKYSNVSLGSLDSAGNLRTTSGSNHTSTFSLAAHYLPTRTTDLNCGIARDIRGSNSNADFVEQFPNFSDTTYQCAASISFN